VRGVAISPDGEYVLSAPAQILENAAGTVKLWSRATGALIRSFSIPPEYKEKFSCLAFSPDGRQVLAGTYERHIWMWETLTGQLLKTFNGHSGNVMSAVFSRDGRHILSASLDHTLILWDAEKGEIVRTLNGHTEGVRGGVFVGDEHALSCSMDGALKLWNLKTGEVVREFAGHADGVRGVAVSQDGRRAVSAGIDRTVRVWHLGPNVEIPQVTESAAVTSLWCSPDGLMFVSGDKNGSVQLRDVATLRLLRHFSGHARPIDTARILPDGHRLFAADRLGECRVWDIATGRELRSDDGYEFKKNEQLRGAEWSFMAVAPDGKFAISSTPEKTLVVRSIESGKAIRTLEPCRHEIRSVAVSPDSKRVLCGDAGGYLYYWDLESGRRIFYQLVDAATQTNPAERVGNPGAVDCIVFSADGQRALTGGHDNTIRLWNLSDRDQINTFEGATSTVSAVGFGREERTLFSVGGDLSLRMWDAPSAKELKLEARFPAQGYALAVIPPGNAVLAAGGSSVWLWDLSRSSHYPEIDSPAADSVRHPDPADGAALARLGEWYAFRGVNDWAMQLLEDARKHGANVSSLTLARCYWQLGRPHDAAREFRAALQRQEALANYIDLCLTVVTSASTASSPSAGSISPLSHSRD
jgi:WD40 repeat protein